jgi:hypothetical protein
MRLDKWEQYNLFKKHEFLKKHLPITKKLEKNSFWEMLDKYKIVIIKPIWGNLGRNIYQVSIIDETEDLYEIHHEGRIRKIKGKHEIYSFIESKIDPSQFLVQQKIHLVSIDKCPIDFRVMVQRKRGSSKWHITGKLAKMAYKGYIITNFAKKILYIEDALGQTSLDTKQIQKAIGIMDRIALTATSHIAAVRPKRRTNGFDFGVDEQGKVWIIEANSKPVITPFKMLEDQSMYRTILRYRSKGKGKRPKREKKKQRDREFMESIRESQEERKAFLQIAATQQEEREKPLFARLFNKLKAN